MKQSKGFMLQTIQGVPYLLPYGQRIAEQRRSMKLNDSGVFLWNSLPHVNDVEELTQQFAAHCHATKEEIPILRQDVEAFVAQLSAWGMIESSFVSQFSSATYVKIAEKKLLLRGPKEAFSKDFVPFYTTNFSSADMTIEVITTTGFRNTFADSTLRIHTSELLVCETSDHYHIYFPTAEQISEICLTKDGSLGQIYCIPPYGNTLQTDIYHAIRLLFLYFGQQHNLHALHSASLSYRGFAWLFSGSSGTGKSTHVNLWHDLYNTPIINGDLNLISYDSTKGLAPRIYGTPWCGTSGIADTKSYQLGGIILLKQAQHNVCLPLSNDEKTLLVSQRFISPSWTQDQCKINLSFAEQLTRQGYITRLCCTKTPDAATYMKSQIDTYIQEQGDLL